MIRELDIYPSISCSTVGMDQTGEDAESGTSKKFEKFEKWSFRNSDFRSESGLKSWPYKTSVIFPNRLSAVKLWGVEMFGSHTDPKYLTGRIGGTNRYFLTGKDFPGIAKLNYKRIKIA